MDKIAIVILNWNGVRFLEQFLSNVVENSPQAKVYIADNGSTDDSVKYVQQNFKGVGVINLDKNYGFCQGYNKALDQINAEYFVILNSDVQVTKGWLDEPITFMDNKPGVSACQPKFLSYSEKEKFEHAGAAGGFIDFLGYPFCRGRIFQSIEVDEGQYNKKEKVFWASGASLIIRSKVFNELGGFDKYFFAHMEEIDLCWRMLNAGHEIYYIPESTVYHVGGGTLAKSNPRKTFLNFRNGLGLLVKNLPVRFFLPILFFRMVLDGVAAIEFFLVGYPRDAFAVFRAHLAFYGMFFKWFNQRKRIPKKLPKEILKKSIVWEHFIRGNKIYNQIS